MPPSSQPHAGHGTRDHRVRFRLTLGVAGWQASAREGEPLRIPGRPPLRWESLPVAYRTDAEVQDYLAWLQETGRVVGARLCREREWERAARGADERRYPHGDVLRPGDGNIDETFGRDPRAMGPAEVGAYPLVRSPFGVDDLLGNSWEPTLSEDGERILRGGCFFQDRQVARSANREPAAGLGRSVYVGLRVCAATPAELR